MRRCLGRERELEPFLGLELSGRKLEVGNGGGGKGCAQGGEEGRRKALGLLFTPGGGGSEREPAAWASTHSVLTGSSDIGG